MDPARTPTAYVVDDDESIRTLWRWLMESNGIAVRAFASAGEFIECYRGEPGCLVLDVRLPGMSGLELQDYLRRNGVDIPIVFSSAHGDIPTAVSAMKGGAVDFIQKPFSYREVLAIIEKAFGRDAEIRAVADRLATLTGRERAVMQRIIEGKPNKLIAADLDISVKTVEYHRAKLMEKTGASSIAELVVFAMQHPRPGAI
jgi:two-component system, LuxR family, response regulator FixJ